jgi:hypothetical protein
MTYAINLWGSKPGTDDDCWTGVDVVTRAEALAIYENPATAFRPQDLREQGELWIQLDGPDIHQDRKLKDADPDYNPHDMSDWHDEMAMQAGMGLGVAAYNDAKGY